MKIDKNKLVKMVAAGKSQKDIAEKFGCSIAAVSKIIVGMRLEPGVQRMALKPVKDKVVVVVPAEEIRKVTSKINYLEQLTKINDRANRILDKAEEGENPSPRLAITAMAEIRSQLKLQLDIFQALYDVEAIQRFHDEITRIIGEVSPELRATLLRRLNEGRESLV